MRMSSLYLQHVAAAAVAAAAALATFVWSKSFLGGGDRGDILLYTCTYGGWCENDVCVYPPDFCSSR